MPRPPRSRARRMYMDTIEKVLARAHKVLIDGKAGSNMIYLPIDKLLDKGAVRDGEPAASDAAASGSKEPDQVTVEARSRAER